MQNRQPISQPVPPSTRYVAPGVTPQGAFTARTLDSVIGRIPEFFAVVDISDVNIVWGE